MVQYSGNIESEGLWASLSFGGWRPRLAAVASREGSPLLLSKDSIDSDLNREQTL